MPDSQAWSPVLELGPSDFGSYGDWPQALLSQTTSALVWVLFLEDVISPDSVLKPGGADSEGLLQSLLAPLALRLQRISAPVVVAWSAARPGSPIGEARAPSPWRQLTRKLSDDLYDLAARHSNLYVIPLDDVLQEGRRTTFDARNYYAARCRLSRQGLAATAQAIASVLNRVRLAAKKLLVLDCDNTLWGGIIGEAGLSGLVLGGDGMGKAFADFQRAVVRCSRNGVMLAIASKNNAPDVLDVFERHPGMVLNRDDIVSFKVNWDDKPSNITAIANELDLGLDSFVFWDDNPMEREQMRLALPLVTTLEVPNDVTIWPAMLDSLDLFTKFVVTGEDVAKTKQYKNRSAFLAQKIAVTDEEQFLCSIAMRPGLHALGASTLARASQLCEKTNQFNLRTIRHSAASLAALGKTCGDCAFLVSLSDRFGDHGIVGLVIAIPAGQVAFLDTLLLSCRVLGRRLEGWMLDQLVAALRRQGCRWLVAQFIPSGRNAVAAGFLSKYEMTQAIPDSMPADAELRKTVARASGGGTIYFADLDSFKVPHLKVFSSC